MGACRSIVEARDFRVHAGPQSLYRPWSVQLLSDACVRLAIKVYGSLEISSSREFEFRLIRAPLYGRVFPRYERVRGKAFAARELRGR